MNCSQCQLDNRQGVNYCTRCGSPLIAVCSHCRAPRALEDIYCGECGIRLPAPSTNRVATPTAISNAGTVQASTSQSAQVPLESERKNVTVLFADISGFTAMSEKMDPEEVTNIMNGCMKMLADIVHRYEGYVDKFIGDCIMAIFGAPVTHENDPELALRAALDMQKEMEEYNIRLQGRIENPLTLHTGVNSGMVIAGGVGSDKKMEYTVMGDTVNLAARLESLAKNGQTFVSGYTYNLTRQHFEFIRHDPIKVKGKKDPVAVYEVVRAKSRQEQSNDTGQSATPLVGRGREMETLRACMERHANGQGLVTFLISPAGVGKSRIHQELKKQFLKGERIQVLEGICRSFNRDTSYAVFIELFRQIFDIDSEDLEESMTNKLVTNLPLLLGLKTETLTEEARRAMVFIGAAMGLKLGAEFDVPLDKMSAQEIKMGIFRSVGWFLQSLSARKPLILTLEDLHLADATSVELIASLFESVKQAPILMLLLMRPQPEHPSNKLPLIADKELDDLSIEIQFKQLTPAECDELTRRLLHSDEVPESVLHLIRNRGDGNPMFIEEIVRNLVEEGIVELVPGEAPRIIKNLDEVTIPSSIQGMFIARIDKLPADLKEVLLTAAVIGPVFRLALLQRLFHNIDLEPGLAKLVEMGLIFESKSFPEIEYSFRNIMIQEAIYSIPLHKKRRELHAAVAHEIETLYASRLDDHFEILAQHHLRADNGDRAYFYLVKSGLKAQETYANTAALAALDKAVELGRNLPNPAIPLLKTLVALSEVQELCGEFTLAIQSRREIIATIVDPLIRIDHMRRIGRLHEKQDNHQQAMTVYEEAHLELAAFPDSVEMGLLLTNESWILNRLGQREEAAARAKRALEIFESHHAKEQIALVCNNLGVIFEHQGDLQQALDYNQKSLKIFSELGDKRQTANLYLSLGFLQEKVGDQEEALKFFDLSHEIMQRIENPFGMGTALMRKGACLNRLNRLSEAEKALKEALRIHRQLNLTRKVVSNLWTLCELHLAMGAPSKARKHMEEARTIATTNDDIPDLAQCAIMEARIRIQEHGEPEEAFQEAIRLYRLCGRHAAAEAAEKEMDRHRSEAGGQG
ncbi:MAG: tetratricopeptide repeat protein [Magnetococcales bacterium]|nr:tetratricopeptide repeat protein [Magnetococcales bacterium]MBF0261462.1 tetratricopeptide repeat protein [Magnetococcales bacterium]